MGDPSESKDIISNEQEEHRARRRISTLTIDEMLDHDSKGNSIERHKEKRIKQTTPLEKEAQIKGTLDE
jgi:hypothetical protein